MTRRETTAHEKLRAVFLAALVVLSVFAGSMAFAGSVAAEEAGNIGPTGFSDQAANAGTLTAGEAGNVQEIEITDDDAAGNDIEINSLDVDLSDSGVSASDVESVSVANSDGVVLKSTSSIDDLSKDVTVDSLAFTVSDDTTETLTVSVTIADDATGHGTLAVSSRAQGTEGGESFTTDYVTDGVSETIDGRPTVEDVQINRTLINDSDAPATVEVNVTFSENVTGYDSTDIQLTDGGDFTKDVTGTLDGDHFSGTVEITDGEYDFVPNLTVDGLQEEDQTSNNIISYDEETDLVVDTDETLSLESAETRDMNDDGTVETINVTFSDDVSDDSVLTAIENGDFELKDGTVEGVNGGVPNDATVSLEVSNVGDTAATDEITVFSDALEDSAGNPGPTDPTGINVEDGAAPAVESTSINKTTINESLAGTDIEVNVTFSEDVTDTYDENDVQLTGLPSSSDQTVSGSLVESDKFSGIATIPNSGEDDAADLTVSGLNDASSNTVDYEGVNAITVDTEPPTVTENTSEVPDGVVNGTLDLTSYFDISEDDGGETTYLINTTNGGTDFTEVENSSEFDSTTIQDTAYLNVQAVDTDDVGNDDSDKTADINVDNTAPDVTIDSPTSTQVSQSDGTLSVEATVVEPNIDGNAEVVLRGDGNEIVYDVPVTEDGNDFKLLLNASEDATASDADTYAPNVESSTGGFDTKTVYTLDVTVNDSTGESTTATQSDVLFLDDTAPEGFSLLEPDEPTEYDLSDNDELQIAYGYTENNTGSVEVSLTNESEGAVANVTVDESQYVDDGVIKSFELHLLESFDTDSLADGRYNVSVTVTDDAGNEYNESTSNAPVAINTESPGVEPEFNEAADASAELDESAEEVTVDVTYNISVPEVDDPGSLSEEQDSLDSVTITSNSDLVTLTVDYWDESAGEYKTGVTEVANFVISNANATENASVTETATIDLTEIDTGVTEDDRVLDRSVVVSGTVTVTATSDWEAETSSDDGVDIASTTLEQQDAVEPAIESIEVDGADTPSDSLTITFNRPIEAADNVPVTSDDFAYQDVSEDGANYVTSVDIGYDTVEVTLNESVSAEDVDSDIVSIQPDVLQNTHSDENVSAVSSTFDETDEPHIKGDAQVQENASQVDIVFDQRVVAGDGGDLTAANFTYVDNNDAGASSIESVESVTFSSVAVVTVSLDADATADDMASDAIRVDDDEVFDRFGNSKSQTVGLKDIKNPSDIEILEPTERQIKQSGDLLDVSYEYVENVPDNTESVTVTLRSAAEDDDTEYTYEIDDSQYVDDGVEKSLTLDLSKAEELAEDENVSDGVYTVEVAATDGEDNTETAETDALVVINDDEPTVESVEVDPNSTVAPDATVDVSYGYDDATNATSVTVFVVDEGVDNFTDGDLTNATFSTIQKNVDHAGDNTVEVDLTGHVEDNENYEVFVSATDESGFANNASKQTSASLNVNAEAPGIDSVEANAGEDTVTVHFSEDVVAGDGDEDLTKADFAYQNVNDAGASAIESVEQIDGDTVELTLDADVTRSGLGNDTINARQGQIVDTDGDNARTVDSSVAIVLEDTTGPSAPSIDAGSVNADNDESYGPVTVNVGDEIVDVTLTVSDGSSSVTDSQSPVEGSVDFTGLDVSALNDTDLTITAAVTDASDGDASETVTVEKDTVSPTIESVETNAGTDALTVTFSEPVSNAEFAGDNLTIVSTEGDGTTYILETQDTVQPSDIDNESVTVAATAGTDDVGNDVDTTSVTLEDGAAPSFASEAVTSNGSTTVTVQFSEHVFTADASADGLSADNFTYVNVDGQDNEVVDVAYDAQTRTATLTLSEPVSPADLNSDYIESDAVDSVGKEVDNHAKLKTGFSVTSYSVTNEDGVVTIEFTTDEELDTLDATLAATEATVANDGVEDLRLTLDEGDFEETENEDGTFSYVKTVDVPRDGGYNFQINGADAVGGATLSHVVHAHTVVDTEDPHPVDAEIVDYDGTLTKISVQFNEPIYRTGSMDVMLDGQSVDVVFAERDYSNGITVFVEGSVQTGDKPEISFTSDSYMEATNDYSQGTEQTTVVNTFERQLSAGANFVSVPAASGELDASEVVTQLGGADNVESIMTYDDGEWKTYNPDKPADEQDFDTLKGGQGYIVTLSESAELEVNVYNEVGGSSAAATPQEAQLEEGWNLVGHWQEGDQRADLAFSSISDGLDGNLAMYGQAQAGSYGYTTIQWHEELNTGSAYWVFVTEDTDYAESQAFVTAD